MRDSFDNLPWHDAVLKHIEIDRTTPGERDEVRLVIEWPDGASQDVLFEDCYKLEADLNFGIIAPESIDTGQCLSQSEGLSKIRQTWSPLGVSLDDLLCFELTTSSTGGAIRVFAKRYALVDRPES